VTSRSIRSRAPTASSANVHRVMVANYGGNTTPELLFRSRLFQFGLRFRKNTRPIASLRCQADIVFSKQQVCVFVDGCFWHGCPKHFRCPKTNAAWWSEKIEANRVRDKRQTKLLQRAGWTVIRIWEHDLHEKRISMVTDRVRDALTSHALH
jgi:DNA mismatch endonuclease (patch repair protein)